MAPKNTVLGMGRPSTAAEMPSASMATTRGSSTARRVFSSMRPPSASSASQLSSSSVSSRYTTMPARATTLRSPMGAPSIFVNARMGAPLRSGPKVGKAKAHAPADRAAAAPRHRAAVKAPWPPRACQMTSSMGIPLSIPKGDRNGRPCISLVIPRDYLFA